MRLKNKGTHSHKRGPKRPKYQAPYPEHPDTVQPVATKDIPTATLLEHALLAQGFMGAQKAAFPRHLRPQNRVSTGANLVNALK